MLVLHSHPQGVKNSGCDLGFSDGLEGPLDTLDDSGIIRHEKLKTQDNPSFLVWDVLGRPKFQHVGATFFRPEAPMSRVSSHGLLAAASVGSQHTKSWNQLDDWYRYQKKIQETHQTTWEKQEGSTSCSNQSHVSVAIDLNRVREVHLTSFPGGPGYNQVVENPGDCDWPQLQRCCVQRQ